MLDRAAVSQTDILSGPGQLSGSDRIHILFIHSFRRYFGTIVSFMFEVVRQWQNPYFVYSFFWYYGLIHVWSCQAVTESVFCLFILLVLWSHSCLKLSGSDRICILFIHSFGTIVSFMFEVVRQWQNPYFVYSFFWYYSLIHVWSCQAVTESVFCLFILLVL
jgi:hypothetical protein